MSTKKELEKMVKALEKEKALSAVRIAELESSIINTNSRVKVLTSLKDAIRVEVENLCDIRSDNAKLKDQVGKLHNEVFVLKEDLELKDKKLIDACIMKGRLREAIVVQALAISKTMKGGADV